MSPPDRPLDNLSLKKAVCWLNSLTSGYPVEGEENESFGNHFLIFFSSFHELFFVFLLQKWQQTENT